jgi:hypothetical protein
MFADGFDYGRWAAIGVIALIAVVVLWVVNKYFRGEDSLRTPRPSRGHAHPV